MAGQKKSGKGSPKLRRAAKPSVKAGYSAQFRETFRNKLRRVLKHNGPDAAAKYRIEHAPKA